MRQVNAVKSGDNNNLVSEKQQLCNVVFFCQSLFPPGFPLFEHEPQLPAHRPAFCFAQYFKFFVLISRHQNRFPFVCVHETSPVSIGLYAILWEKGRKTPTRGNVGVNYC